MYRFYINNVSNDYHFSELCRVFLDDGDFETIPILSEAPENICLTDSSFMVNSCGSSDRDEIKRELYRLLTSLTGKSSEWGTLTGVRPLKLAFEEYRAAGDVHAAAANMTEKYLVSRKKSELLREILEYQIRNVPSPEMHSAGIYIGIPFCPTRCVYCAFASYVAGEEEINDYFCRLLQEIRVTGAGAVRKGIPVESIYIGGGTPTTLSAVQLSKLIETAAASFGADTDKIEFTVEAGRPDTIDEEKLLAIKNAGAERISINPQSMNDRTLVSIGRAHTAEDIETAFDIAGKIGFDTINADVIAGLPGETLEDFKYTLEKVIELGANNITVHTLSVKHGSRLREESPDFYRNGGAAVSEMLDSAHEMLADAGFSPYYIYRQKHQTGALENVGYCRQGKHSLYNIRIMEEKQTIIGLGAGAIGKIYYPDEDRLERVPNVSNYQVYCDRFDEMLERKNKYFGGWNGNKSAKGN